MSKTLTVEGQISNLDGIMFYRRLDPFRRKEYVEAVFYTEFTTELLDRIMKSGIDQCKPARVTLTIEQDEP